MVHAAADWRPGEDPSETPAAEDSDDREVDHGGVQS
jgi:hypothetical protein